MLVIYLDINHTRLTSKYRLERYIVQYPPLHVGSLVDKIVQKHLSSLIKIDYVLILVLARIVSCKKSEIYYRPRPHPIRSVV